MGKKQTEVRKLNTIRNIGVIAHIDAGKTTTTERFLFYSGKTHRIGDVDEGNTVTDYLEEERNRGITIVAAAASFNWTVNNNEYLVHLIDTPGHIDFTAEVERSIRVSDGAVVIFSGVEGVEAQSEKVWRQSEKYNVPKIAFINKLDRLGASYKRVFSEMKIKFPDVSMLQMHLPMGMESDFKGIIDLVSMKAIFFEGEEKNFERKICPIPEEFAEEAKEARDELISTVADLSEDIADLYLEEQEIPEELLKQQIREQVLQGKACPVFAGSAKRNIGIQPLMDAIVNYLPSPEDKAEIEAINPKTEEKIFINIHDNAFCGLIFKIVAGEGADILYLRTYSGKLSLNDTLLNTRTKEKVRIKRLLRLYAKNVQPIEEVGPGDIVGIIGPQNVVTGDTLCSVNRPVALEKIVFPEPVISMAVEPKSAKDKDKLEHVLNMLCREDPTLEVKRHENTGQLILSGMGELHLEINSHRISKEFNIEARFGAPQVAFRETVKQECTVTGIFNKVIGEQELYAEVSFTLQPVMKLETFIEVKTDIKQKTGQNLPVSWIKTACQALEDGLRTGGNWGYPLIYIRGIIKEIKGTPDKTTESAIVGAVLNGLSEAIRQGTILLEPVMRLDIIAPEESIGEITGYLQGKRAIIHSIDTIPGGKHLKCEAPLAEMFGFSKALPKLSGGRASMSMEPCGYQELSPEDMNRMT